MNHSFLFLKKPIALMLTLLLIAACRKDIKTPSVDTANVFGSWKWVSSASAGGGVIQTPTSAGYTIELEYTEKGVFKEFSDGKKTEKLIFEFIEGTTINFEPPGYIIKYRNNGMNRREKFRENFEMQGQDTLVLWRHCDNCYKRTYVRQ